VRKTSFYLSILLLSTTFVFAGDGHIRHNAKPISGDYIVKLSSSLSPADVQRLADNFANIHHGHIKYIWRQMLPGFAISGISDMQARQISASPLVDLVEEDAAVSLAAVPVQTPAPWHLDRLDQRPLPLDTNYFMDCTLNRDVVIYIVDSGVRGTHHEFWTSSMDPTSRVLDGYQGYSDPNDIFGRANDPCSTPPPANAPCDSLCLNGGHGTSVASIAAGLQYGVAKTAKIIPVRIRDCQGGGNLSRAVDGLNWIYEHPRTEPGVVNLSMTTPAGDSETSTFETAIDQLVNQRGLTVVAAAGNRNEDVQGFTPARHSRANGGTAITVGGTNNEDHRWVCNPANSWESIAVHDPNYPNDPSKTIQICDANVVGSNWGTGVDIFAPSQNIPSASLKIIKDGVVCMDDNGCMSDTATRPKLLSGTSFAAPIVAGLAARYLQTTGLVNPTPAQVWSYILGVASGDSPSTPPAVLVDSAGANSGPLNGSPNRLVYAPFQTRCSR
jgi:subtilisin family serine protease